MHRIQVNITPPKPGTAESNLTPNAWLLSDQMVDILSNKDLPIYQEEQISLSLDPVPTPNDHSILAYHKRVSEMLPNDREKLAVTMPANDWMERLREVSESQDYDDLIKLKIYKSDLMIKFVEKLELMLAKKGVQMVEKGGSSPGHDRKSKMSRSKTILDNISAQTFTQRTGLPPQYRTTIANFETIVEKRNDAVHDTQFHFARLLLKRQFKDPVNATRHNLAHWVRLLLWVTGYETLEEMAAVAANVATAPTPDG